MQAPNQEEETEKIGDDVKTEVDLRLESARVIRYSDQLERLFQARRHRDFPISIWPQFVNTLVKFLVWRDHVCTSDLLQRLRMYRICTI